MPARSADQPDAVAEPLGVSDVECLDDARRSGALPGVAHQMHAPRSRIPPSVGEDHDPDDAIWRHGVGWSLDKARYREDNAQVETRRTTVRDVRRANRASLLTDLFHGGRLSRQELGDTTALSQASVSNLIGEMIDEGLVEEAGLIGSDGGRPRAMLRVTPGYAYVVGADVGETRVLVELYDLGMQRLATAQYALGRQIREPAVVLARLLDGLAAVLAAAAVDPQAVLGFGVGVSGVVEQDGVVHAQALGWDGVPLGAMLRVGTDIAVHVDNGAKTLGQAEMWFGAGRGARQAVVALVGTGVGAAVVVDGRSYRGAHSSAGEWGHTTLVYGGRPCRCGALGCLEAYVGAAAVVERLAEATGSAAEPDLLRRVLVEEPPAAAPVLAETIGYLGAGIAGLVNLFNPERIVLGGWAGLALGERFLPEIRSAVARHALRQPYSRTSIELCRLGPDAVATGAATLPVATLLADGGRSVAGPAAVPKIPRQYRRSAPRSRS
jgi:predicted NBD/HSP70 family sugar kinase